MDKKFCVFALIATIFLTSCGSSEPKWEPLFNGTDFTGWETYLGVPHNSVDVPGMELNEEGNYTQPVGLNVDPLNVFSVVQIDGAPAVRISGQIFGSFSTKEEYGNYHLRFETKWGETLWQPWRWNGRRNSGLLYHSVGEFGEGLSVWKISHECQIMENDFGDSFRMGSNVFCDVTASRPSENERYVFDPAAPSVRFGSGMSAGSICVRNPMNEKPVGQWNTIELICFEGTSIHVINGTVNMINTNSHLLVNGVEVPLTKGAIQLQSEGAEIFFRNIEIRTIDKIPAEYLR